VARAKWNRRCPVRSSLETPRSHARGGQRNVSARWRQGAALRSHCKLGISSAGRKVWKASKGGQSLLSPDGKEARRSHYQIV
jgi:hypothetical protein